MSALARDDRAPNLLVGEDVRIAQDAQLGANVVIHAGARVGPGVIVQDGAVLGKLPVLGERSSSSREAPPPLVIERGAVICTGAVVFAGAQIGEHAIIGDQSHVRERATVGERAVVGRGCAIGPGARIGARVRLQTMVWITGGAVVEEDAFVGPGVMTMNDNQMGRRSRTEPLDPPRLRRACRVGGGVLITPGVEVGEEAFVASGAVLTSDVPARAKIRGVPGRAFGEVDDGELLERWHHS